MRDKLINLKKDTENNVEKKEFINNIRKDLIDVKFDEGFIIIDIKDECKFFDYSYIIDNCYNELRNVFILMKKFITNGGNIFDYKLFKQKIYVFSNNKYDYMIAVSDNVVRISMRELKDKFIYETELDFNNIENIHDIINNFNVIESNVMCDFTKTKKI